MFSKISKQALRPIGRLTEAWQTTGAVRRAADTRTAQELKTTLEAYAQTLPEIAKFKKDIKALPMQHQGLVADVAELASSKIFLPTDVNMFEVVGKETVLERLVGDIIIASKKNPDALDCTQEIINNTGSTPAKWILSAMSGGIIKQEKAAKQFAATKEMIPILAEHAFQGGYTADHKGAEYMVDCLKRLLTPEVKPESIKFVTEFSKNSNKFENLEGLHLDEILNTKAPIEKLRANFEVLPQINDMKNISPSGQKIDPTTFLINNVNLY